MAKIDVNTLEIMANIIKSPADAVAIVKGSEGKMSESTIAGIIGFTIILNLNKVEISEDSFIKFININRFYKANSKLIA